MSGSPPPSPGLVAHAPAGRSRPPLKSRIRYRFDTTMSRGAIALVLYLALAALLLVLVGALLYAVFGGGDASFGTRLWDALGRAMDSGTFTGDAGWGFRIISLLVTLAGIFLVSALIGLIATALDQRIEELRKGRTPVLERGHTLILGWSEALPVIIGELVIANENQKDACVVVMARKDKVEMEDELRGRIPKGASTRLVCRTGNPADPDDLELVDPLGAKSVIVLSEPELGGDAQGVKVALSLMTFDQRLERIPVTVELQDARHAEALDVATAGRAKTVVTSDLIARVTAQICYQSGLSLVVQELLDFDGDEVYFRAEPELAGQTYGDAQLAYADATVFGLRHADGSVRLNPPAATVIAPDDLLVTVAEDDDAFTLAPTTAAAPSRASAAAIEPPLRALVIGWNALGPRVLVELDGLVSPGSTLHVIADSRLAPLDALAPARVASLEHLAVTVEDADTADDAAVTRAVDGADYDRIVLLCYRDALGEEEADARTLLTLLLVRRVIDQDGHRNRTASVVTELLDVRAVKLAGVANPDDFVVSERLTSLALAQLSENAELDAVFDELFGARGCDVRLVPARSYLPEGGSFADAIAACAAHDETALGYRSAAAATAAQGVVVNPEKSARVTADDQIVLLRR